MCKICAADDAGRQHSLRQLIHVPAISADAPAGRHHAEYRKSAAGSADDLVLTKSVNMLFRRSKCGYGIASEFKQSENKWLSKSWMNISQTACGYISYMAEAPMRIRIIWQQAEISVSNSCN